MLVNPALVLAATLTQQRMNSLSGTIEKIENFESKTLSNRRNINVYLPPPYSSDTKRTFSVLYMHDGQNVFNGMTSYIPNQEWRADEAAESLISAGLIEPIIIVAIDNAGADRANEFLYKPIRMGNQTGGGRADLYGKFLVEEVMPMINSKYRTKIGPEFTGLVGSSFGGVITSYLGITRPEVFGKLGIVSPSVWVDDRSLLKMVKPLDRKLKRQRVWIDMGTKEGANASKDAADLYHSYLGAGFKPNKEVTLVIEPNAEHNELSWSRRMMGILLYLFGTKG
jgi:predicted alpha/beta superfamily hydrolase